MFDKREYGKQFTPEEKQAYFNRKYIEREERRSKIPPLSERQLNNRVKRLKEKVGLEMFIDDTLQIHLSFREMLYYLGIKMVYLPTGVGTFMHKDFNPVHAQQVKDMFDNNIEEEGITLTYTKDEAYYYNELKDITLFNHNMKNVRYTLATAQSTPLAKMFITMMSTLGVMDAETRYVNWEVANELFPKKHKEAGRGTEEHRTDNI